MKYVASAQEVICEQCFRPSQVKVDLIEVVGCVMEAGGERTESTKIWLVAIFV